MLRRAEERFARRNLDETKRFKEMKRIESPSFLRIFRTPYRKRVLQLALIWGAVYACTQTAVLFWKNYAKALDVVPRFDDAAVGRTIAIAAVLAMPLVFLVGRMLDWLGRRAKDLA